MSKLYIAEYARIAYAPYQVPLMIPSEEEPSHDQTPVDFSGGHAESAAFQRTTKFIRIWADEDCCVVFGSAPVATTNSKPLAAKTEMWVSVKQGTKVSAIAMA